MKYHIRQAASALVLLLASVAVAPAASNDWTMLNDRGFQTFAQQDRLVLSSAQEHLIFQSLSGRHAKRQTAPPGFVSEIGQTVPKSITLHRLPANVTNRVWAAATYSYALLQNELLIVNPRDRIVDDIIAQ